MMANAIIDRARAHYASHGTQSIDVPEWGDESGPLMVYWTPITLAERQKIANRAKDGQTQDAMAYAVIIKARDGKGDLLFTLDDKHALIHGVDATVVDRLAAAMLSSPTVEEAEKN